VNKNFLKTHTFAYRNVVSWVLGLAIAIYLISTVNVDILKLAFKEAALIHYFVYSAIFVLFWYVYESQNLFLFIRYYGYKAKFNQILILRASTYLLMLINYHLSTGGILISLNVKHGIPLKESTGLTLLYTTTDTLCLSILTFCATVFAASYIPRNFVIPLLAVSLVTIIIILVIFAGFRSTHIFRLKWLNGIYQIINEELLKISTFSYLKIFILRSIYFLTFSIFIYISVPLFGFEIPFIAVLALLPPIFFIGNLPITPAGIGTIQAAMLFFFAPFGETHRILLFSLIYSTSLILYRLFIGLSSLFFLDNKKLYFETLDNFKNYNNLKKHKIT
jgi:uncharacterized membrane protein YbhN (UPF0104 family)